MRIIVLPMLIAVSINLTACSSLSGNVIPQKGPSMEQIYDSMGESSIQSKNNNKADKSHLTKVHQEASDASTAQALPLPGSVYTSADKSKFHKLPNPELQLYISPHVAGQDEVPIPGYFTAFDAYERNYYALPYENARG